MLNQQEIAALPESILASFSANLSLKQKLYLELFERTLGLGKQELLRRMLQIGISNYLTRYHEVIDGQITIKEYYNKQQNQELDPSLEKEIEEIQDIEIARINKNFEKNAKSRKKDLAEKNRK